LLGGGIAGVLANAIYSPKPHGFVAAAVSEGIVQSINSDAQTVAIAVKKGDRFEDRSVPLDGLDLLDRSGDPASLDTIGPRTRVRVIQQSGKVVALRAETRLEWFSQNIAEFVGQVFLRLIFMAVVPLVFSALTLGIAGIGDVRKLGRMGARTLIFTIALSSASVAIGLVLANTIRPGERLSPEKQQELKERYATRDVKALEQAKQSKSLRDSLLDITGRRHARRHVLCFVLRSRNHTSARADGNLGSGPGRTVRRFDDYYWLGNASGSVRRGRPGVLAHGFAGLGHPEHARMVRGDRAPRFGAAHVWRLLAGRDFFCSLESETVLWPHQ
jgi:hypothetical protein